MRDGSTHAGSPSSSLTAALLADRHQRHPTPSSMVPTRPQMTGEFETASSAHSATSMLDPSSGHSLTANSSFLVGSPWGMGRGGGVFMRAAPGPVVNNFTSRLSMDGIREGNTEVPQLCSHNATLKPTCHCLADATAASIMRAHTCADVKKCSILTLLASEAAIFMTGSAYFTSRRRHC